MNTPITLALLAHTTRQEIQAVIFFRDPHGADPPELAFADLLQVCDYQEILLATNPATAEALLYFLQSSPQRGVVAARAWGRVPISPDPIARLRPLISNDLQRF